MELYLHLKNARKSARQTAEEAARYLGVQADMIFRFESGRSSPNLNQLGLLAECYGMQLGDMFPGSETRTHELKPFILALEAFEPEERADIVMKAARDLTFTAALLNTRVARHSEKMETVSRAVPYTPPPANKNATDTFSTPVGFDSGAAEERRVPGRAQTSATATKKRPDPTGKKG
jgi:transcriptional regulator with XRE-family HTH domain